MTVQRDEKNLYRFLTEQSRELICLHDANGNYVYISPSCRKILGYEPQELVGLNPLDFYHEEDKERILEEAQRHLLKKDNPATIIYRFKKKDGSYIWLHTLSQPILNEDNEVVELHTTSRDVTKERKMQQTIDRSFERLKKFIKCNPSSVAMLDNELRYLSTSDRWIKDYRLKLKDLTGLRHYDIFPDTPDRWRKIHQKALAGETIRNEKDSLRRRNGKKEYLRWEVGPWYKTDDEIGGIIMMTEMITARVEAEEGLRKSEELLRETGEMAKVGGWQIDLESMSPVWSRQTYKIYELDPDIQPDLNQALRAFQGEAKKVIKRAVEQAAKTGKGYDLELPFITAKGKKLWVRTIGRPEFKDGVAVAVKGILQDITIRKMAELELTESHRRLEKLSDQLSFKNSQLREFNYVISHNIRTPVSNIQALFQLLDTAEDDAEKQLYNESIRKMMGHLHSTLENLLEIVKIKQATNIEVEKLSLSLKFKRTVEMLDAEIWKTGAKITSDFGQADQVLFYRPYLESIFLNLLSNALKYRSPDRTPEIHISSAIEGGQLILRISDNGLGIDLNQHGSDVFKLNKTFHRNKDAKGVGLFITKSQIEALGGEINVESKINKGTTFIIKFKNDRLPPAVSHKGISKNPVFRKE